MTEVNIQKTNVACKDTLVLGLTGSCTMESYTSLTASSSYFILVMSVRAEEKFQNMDINAKKRGYTNVKMKK